jgi:hypothetical protein
VGVSVAYRGKDDCELEIKRLRIDLYSKSIGVK